MVANEESSHEMQGALTNSKPFGIHEVGGGCEVVKESKKAVVETCDTKITMKVYKAALGGRRVLILYRECQIISDA